jgi:hypothetical protein
MPPATESDVKSDLNSKWGVNVPFGTANAKSTSYFDEAVIERGARRPSSSANVPSTAHYRASTHDLPPPPLVPNGASTPHLPPSLRSESEASFRFAAAAGSGQHKKQGANNMLIQQIPDTGRAAPAFSAAEVADRILAGTDGHVVVGPIRHRPSDERFWRFFVATCKAGSFHIEEISMLEPDEGARRDIVDALLLRPVSVYDTDNELIWAQICASRWPCAETAEILDVARRHYGVPAASRTPVVAPPWDDQALRDALY